MNRLFVYFVKFYQKFISPTFPSSCRYYPTCSEYAIWQLRYKNPFVALLCIVRRILSCNQYFKGGIDYPKIRKKFTPKSIFFVINIPKISFWFVPYKKDCYFIIKSY